MKKRQHESTQGANTADEHGPFRLNMVEQLNHPKNGVHLAAVSRQPH